MKLNIKTRILLNGVISVVISISLVTAIVTVILWEQGEERARQQIDRAVGVIDLKLGAARADLTKMAAKMGRQQEYALNARFIQENRENKALADMLDGERRALATHVYEAALAGRAPQIVLFDSRGEWMCSVDVEKKRARIAYLSDSNKWLAQEAVVTTGEFPLNEQWQKKLKIRHLLFNYSLPIPEKAETAIREREGRLWLTATAPLMANVLDSETLEDVAACAGLVQVALPIDREFVDEICDLTNTGVNLFVDGQYIAGTLESYKNLEPEWDSAYTANPAGIIGTENSIFKTLSTSEGIFFEGLVPIASGDRNIGAFSILLSQADTRKSQWEMVRSLVLVALACVVLTVPLTWFFAVREIVERERMQKELARHRDHLEEMVHERTVELSEKNRLLDSKNIELNHLFEKVNSANREIMASLRYAKGIQRSLLPEMRTVREFLPEHFFIWSPSEIVGGDLFHADAFDDGIVIALFDCTGHGIPGAFMTMIASSGIRSVTRIENCRNPAKILERLNQMIKTQLRQDTDHALSNDGMDAAVCFADTKTVLPNGNKIIRFAGARISLVCVENGKTTVIKGDRQSIGYRDSDLEFGYAEHEIEAKDGMCFYMATDGITDQLGGDSGLRLGKKRFHNLLAENAHLPLGEQRQRILRAFGEYLGEEEIRDDITVVGFKI